MVTRTSHLPKPFGFKASRRRFLRRLKGWVTPLCVFKGFMVGFVEVRLETVVV